MISLWNLLKCNLTITKTMGNFVFYTFGNQVIFTSANNTVWVHLRFTAILVVAIQFCVCPSFLLLLNSQLSYTETLAAENFGGFSSSWPIRQSFICQKFYPSYFVVQNSQSTNVLLAKMLIGSNPSKFSTAKVCATRYVLT